MEPHEEQIWKSKLLKAANNDMDMDRNVPLAPNLNVNMNMKMNASRNGDEFGLTSSRFDGVVIGSNGDVNFKPILEKIFRELTSDYKEERKLASISLFDLLVSLEHELSIEEFQAVSNDINNKILELVHTKKTSTRVGAVLSIDTLISFYAYTERLPNETSRLAGYLRGLIPSNDVEVMRLAAKTLGKLAVPGGTYTSDFVEFEIKSCLEWLTASTEKNSFSSSKPDHAKHAALLIITALAENCPYLLYQYLNSILDNIWRALRDPHLVIRIDASITLAKCLSTLRNRDPQLTSQWVQRLATSCEYGFQVNTLECIHASLLVYKEILFLKDPFLNQVFDQMCLNCIAYENHKAKMIREKIYQIVPLLASFNPQLFAGKYLHQIMDNYLEILTNAPAKKIPHLKDDKPQILISIGDIAYEVGPDIAPYVKQILDYIEHDLQTKFKFRKKFENEIFYCIGRLAVPLGPVLGKLLNRNILDLMFKCPLSDYMQETFQILTERIPSLGPKINDELLNLVCSTLSGTPFIQPGSPMEIPLFSRERAREWRNKSILQKTGESNDDNNDIKIIIQAFRMLKNIKSRFSLVEFVRIVALSYIEHTDPRVRKLAALTSCEIYVKDNICKQTSLHSLNTVSEVLSKLLAITIADPLQDIRLEVLKNLNPCFDPQLAQPDNLRLLFTALHDESFNIQSVAMELVGRLSSVNPAYVIPSIRKILLELLTKLKFSTSSREKEETASLLCTLIRSSKDVAKPYIEPLLNVLLPKFQDTSSTVASTALRTIGELSVVGGEDMKIYLKDLFPLIIKTFQDQSNSFKREAALKALGQLAASSGYVIDPLLDYPELLGILVNILKTENSQNIRRQTVTLIGILGAIDPYRQKEREVTSTTDISTEQNAPPIDIALLMQGMSPSNDEYYTTVVIHCLLKILKDPSLSSYHTAVIQAIMHIFQTLGLKCVSFLDQIIPTILDVMRTCSQSLLEFYFQQLCSLIIIVRQHIRPHVDSIFQAIKDFSSVAKLQITLVSVIEAISKALEGEFKRLVPLTLTLFLVILENDKSSDKVLSRRVLRLLESFGPNLEGYSHLITPKIVQMAEFTSGNLQRSAIITIGKLAKDVDLFEMSSRIVHSLLRVLSSTTSDELSKVIMNTLSLLLIQMGTSFAIFIPVINEVLMKKHIQHTIYDDLTNRILNNDVLPTKILEANTTDYKPAEQMEAADAGVAKLPINQSVLKSAWNSSQQRTKEDWQEWSKRLSIQLLKESPSHALRACSNLASMYYPLAKELFNTAFACVWTELYSQYQEDLIESLCIALSSPLNPPEIHQTLLNLVEFMEHDDKALPIPTQSLGEYAERCHAYAKALHYKEIKFIKEPENSTIESLISINNQLNQTDAAIGILKHAQQHHSLQLKETWFEKLERWEDALHAYNEREKAGDTSVSVTLGKMRSLHALGEWEQLSQLAARKWKVSKLQTKKLIAPLAAGAAWGLGEWDMLEQYISVMKPKSPDKEFFDAILYLHKNDYDNASKHILNARDLLVTEISALINESYNRAYSVIVRTQIITEFEEIIKYKQLPPNSEKKLHYQNLWTKRLLGCQKNVDLWQRVLRVRSLVIKPKQDLQIWIKFANLCRKSGRMRLANKALNMLLEGGNDPSLPNTFKAPPPVVYAQLKYIWATGAYKEALNHLIGFTSRLAHDLGLDPNNMIAQSVKLSSASTAPYVEEYTKLLARCFLKQGEWRIATQPNWRNTNPDAILGSYLLATHFDKNWYKAWHNWALANFEVISMVQEETKLNGGQNDDDDDTAVNNDNVRIDGSILGSGSLTINGNRYPLELIQRHVVPAIKGFFHSISLLETSCLQDTLRLLTLLFNFGGIKEVSQAMYEGFNLMKIENWLEVLPQLISRIHQPDPTVSNSLLSLLSDLGKAHPQALVYPLTVAIKSESVSRQKAALSIIEKIRIHSPVLVNQAELVSHELIRVAVLWHELWYEGLEDASRQFFVEHNIEKMFSTLEPLHKHLGNEPQTLSEVSFQKSFGRDLNDAYEWLNNYKKSKDINNLNQAWDIYYNVFRKITRQIPQLQTLDLQHVSPQLLATHDLELAVPGTYFPGKPTIRIAKFEPLFSVISSKQRPRKFSIKGSDGKDYKYVLKGHEDIRQDSLVMQLFGLVNTLLKNDSECFKRHLDIQQYPAIPLSPKSGLLGWVPNSDTFHVLIREHRDAKKIPLNIEHWVMLQMAPDYENLTLLQKIEVFTYALDNTKGQDLYKILWLKSRSSETWLERRTTYTRSLAVMSMTGYILGLGDRHPSNLMLDRITGKVIHIDFGDCFEAAILREKYPEKVPFRLTRMLTYAMEVSGIEGSFRITCENVMRVLRDNKESLMAILEAFALDPLIHWGFDLPPQKLTEQTGIPLPLINPSELLRKGAITVEEAANMEAEQQNETKNARAMLVLRRITDKLTGNDIKRFNELDVPEQVDKLIQQATSIERLCQHYIGWCPFW